MGLVLPPEEVKKRTNMADPIKKRTVDQLRQRQRILQIAIFSLVTIMVWVGLSLFRTQRSSSIDPALRELAIPLTPTINQDVISNLEQKRVYQPNELRNFPIYKFIVNNETGTEEVVTIDVEQEVAGPAPSPTPSPTPSPSPTASTSEETTTQSTTNEEGVVVDPTFPEPQGSENEASDQAI